MNKFLKESEWLIIDAEGIRDRIANLGGKDAVPIMAIKEDVAQLCYRYARLRTDLEDKK